MTFDLNSKVQSESEIKVLENALDFDPIWIKINKPELRRRFQEFCTSMKIK